MDEYCYFSLCSHQFQSWLIQEGSGTATPLINKSDWGRSLLPVPPLAEQRRIVAALDGCLSLVDTVERDGEELDALFGRLRSKVLDLAVRGELTERDPSDEPAGELLARIHAEKLAMVGCGELKPKDVKGDTVIFTGSDGQRYEKRSDGKGEAVCIEDEIPFEIPKTWAWARLLTPTALNPKNRVPDETEASFLPMAAIDDAFQGTFHPEKRLWRDIKKGYTQFADGDVVFAKISPCFENGKYFVAHDLCNGVGSGTTELFVLRSPEAGLNRTYLLFFLASSYFMDGAKKTFMGTVGQQRIKRDYLEKTLLPVPPLAEQKRIVEKVETILRQLL
jgi:type I restriction enzyme S subunit